MKKLTSIILLCTILLLTGCGKEPASSKETMSSETTASNSLETKEHTEIASSAEESTSASTGTDCDLTAMDEHDAYHTLEQILLNPDDYVGKNIKITGEYSPVWYDHAQQQYHYILLADSDGCSQMLEFIWGDGTHVYPDEYPKSGATIEISGKFETYQDKGDPSVYCRLANATLNVTHVLPLL